MPQTPSARNSRRIAASTMPRRWACRRDDVKQLGAEDEDEHRLLSRAHQGAAGPEHACSISTCVTPRPISSACSASAATGTMATRSSRRARWLPADAQARDRCRVPQQAAQPRSRREDDAWDAFVAWAPTRNISLVAAYLNLGGVLAPVTGVTQRSGRRVRVRCRSDFRERNHMIRTTIVRLLAVALRCRRRAARSRRLFEQIGGESGAAQAVVEEFVDQSWRRTTASTSRSPTPTSPNSSSCCTSRCASSPSGPCKYTGRTMLESHEKLELNNAMFNALAEDLYIAFERRTCRIACRTGWWRCFAPMQRDIVK